MVENVEPVLEESPEEGAKMYVISKYAGDYFFPSDNEPPAPLVADQTIQAPSWLGGGSVSSMSRARFFQEVNNYFASIAWTPRPSRARPGAQRPTGGPRSISTPQAPPGPAITPGPVPAQPGPGFMEAVEQLLISKFHPEALRETSYRTKREYERREGEKREFVPRLMSKAQFLEDLESKIGSVQWRAKNPDHGAKVANRPGISKKYQEELEGV